MTEIGFWIMFVGLFVFFVFGVSIGRYQVENKLDYLGREIKEEEI